MMAGGVIAHKSKFQATMALSSAEAEFTAAAKAGKTILHLRSALKELGYEQHEPTTLHTDNQGALHMANAEQPTRRTRHMDAKAFAMQQWTKEQCPVLESMNAKTNAADHFSEASGRIKFHEQTDVTMGRRKPTWTRKHDDQKVRSNKMRKQKGGERVTTPDIGPACCTHEMVPVDSPSAPTVLLWLSGTTKKHASTVNLQQDTEIIRTPTRTQGREGSE